MSLRGHSRRSRRMHLAVLAAVAVVQGARAALTTDEQQALLAKHNALRGAQSVPCTATNMRQLSWDDQLASVAQAHAETCVWAHNRNRNDQLGYSAGENLCAFLHRSNCAAAATDVRAWLRMQGSLPASKPPNGSSVGFSLGTTRSPTTTMRLRSAVACAHTTRRWSGPRRRHSDVARRAVALIRTQERLWAAEMLRTSYATTPRREM